MQEDNGQYNNSINNYNKAINDFINTNFYLSQ